MGVIFVSSLGCVALGAVRFNLGVGGGQVISVCGEYVVVVGPGQGKPRYGLWVRVVLYMFLRLG